MINNYRSVIISGSFLEQKSFSVKALARFLKQVPCDRLVLMADSLIENGEELQRWKPKYIKLLSRIINLVEKNRTSIIIIVPVRPHPKINGFLKGIAEIRTDYLLKSGSSNFLIYNSPQYFKYWHLLKYIMRPRNEVSFSKKLSSLFIQPGIWKTVKDFKDVQNRPEIIARFRQADGIIGGGFHKPVILTQKSLTLINVGYWHRYSVALVETRENEWQFVYYGETGKSMADNPGVVIREVF